VHNVGGKPANLRHWGGWVSAALERIEG